jgi:hypothetical protein
MGKFFISVLFFFLICSCFQEFIKPSSVESTARRETDCPCIRYEDIKDGYWMKNWRRSDEYQVIYSYVKDEAKKRWPHDYERRQKEIKNFMSNYEEEVFDNYQKKEKANVLTQDLKKVSVTPEKKKKTYIYSADMGIPKEAFEKVIKDYNSLKKEFFKNDAEYNQFVNEYVDKQINKYKIYFKHVNSNRNSCGIPIEIYDAIVENSLELYQQTHLEDYLKVEIQSYKDIYLIPQKYNIPDSTYREIVKDTHKIWGVRNAYSMQKSDIEERVAKYKQQAK